MIKNLFNICFALLAIVNINAQSFWKKTVESKIAQRNGDERTVVPATKTLVLSSMKPWKKFGITLPPHEKTPSPQSIFQNTGGKIQGRRTRNQPHAGTGTGVVFAAN